jgi:hypothetical protein
VQVEVDEAHGSLCGKDSRATMRHVTWAGVDC